LQLNLLDAGLVSKWAIVDPQRAVDKDEQDKILEKGMTTPGWLRFGHAIPQNTDFAKLIAEKIGVKHAVDLGKVGHGELGKRALNGDRLNGEQNLYEFLGITFKDV
jgi:hypothetical protein